MTTPFDGKLNWWHYRADSVAFDTRTALAKAVRERTPQAAGVIVKVVHGAAWEGPRARRQSTRHSRAGRRGGNGVVSGGPKS